MRLSNRTCGHVAVAPAAWRPVAASPARCGILKVQIRSRILPCVTCVKKRAGLWGSFAEWRDIQPWDPSACWNHLTRPTHRLFRQCGRPPGVKVKAKRNCPKPAFHSFNTQKVPFRIKYLARRVYDWQVVTGGLFLLLLLLCLAEANQNLPISSTLQRHNLPCVTPPPAPSDCKSDSKHKHTDIFISTASSLKVNKTCGCSFPAASLLARSLTANCAFGGLNLNGKEVKSFHARSRD